MSRAALVFQTLSRTLFAHLIPPHLKSLHRTATCSQRMVTVRVSFAARVVVRRPRGPQSVVLDRGDSSGRHLTGAGGRATPRRRVSCRGGAAGPPELPLSLPAADLTGQPPRS
jgi:hypothetical protein